MSTIPIRKINPPDNEPKISQHFRIRNVRDLLGGKDMVQDLHRHNFFFILALEKGRGMHEIDFAPHKVTNRSIFIMRPGQVHKLTLKAGSTGFLMEVNTGFFQRRDRGSDKILRKASNLNACQVERSVSKKLHAVLAAVLQEYIGQHDGYEEVIHAHLDIFFTWFIRQAQQPGGYRKGTHYQQERLEKFLEVLEQNIHTHKQASAYAAMLHMSSYQLNAITRASLGKTSSEVINEYIVLEAKRHLLATPDQVNQIAYQLGYEDTSYFIRFFKKHTGLTPEAFRSNFK